ncbi:MAG: xrtN [Flaviaesturariibacter sp.]|nr:xrtN [Flaviaesturariibacter sp.]
MPDLVLAWKSRLDGRFLLLAGAAALGAFCLHGYIQPLSLSTVLGVIALPFTVHRATSDRLPKRYAVSAALFLLLSVLAPVKTLLYFAFGFSFLYGIEMQGYRVRLLGVAALVVMSPVFYYAANTVSFPVRLQLTAWVGHLFRAVSAPVETAGNMISSGRADFSVDPACMGLNMLVASLLLGIMLAGFFESREKRLLRPAMVALLLAFVAFLNVLSNVVRIFLVVQFVLLPGAVMHELAGVGCLLLYVALPAAWFARRMVRRAPASPVPVHPRPTATWPVAALACGLLLAGIRVSTVDTFNAFRDRAGLAVSGYQASLFAPGIVKLQSPCCLVYIKYLRGFYDTDHNPGLCWKGSGYSLGNVRAGTFGADSFFTATMTKGTDTLYTAWWYGNDRIRTTDQWTWRRAMLRGDPYMAVVNVTASSPEARDAEVRNLIARHSFDRFFKPMQ